jgi:hypothetical protein
MNYRKLLWRVAIVLLLSSLGFALPQNHAAAPEALTPIPQDATEYVRQTVQRELDAQKNDHSHWRYRYHREDEKGSQDRDVIDAKEGQLARTLLINGQPLTAEQRQADEDRMKKLVADASERAKRAKREKDDEDKLTQMFKAIPEAFIFKYDGAENGQVRLTFFPNPHYEAPSRELQIFRSMSGKMWIDRVSGRLCRMDGALFEDVTFGWGLLGRLNKGGTFTVVQSNVGGNHWDVVSLDVKMTGHAVIFKTLNIKQMQRFTNFQHMRDDLTIAEAYQLLEKGNPISAGNQAGIGKNTK